MILSANELASLRATADHAEMWLATRRRSTMLDAYRALDETRTVIERLAVLRARCLHETVIAVTPAKLAPLFDTIEGSE